MSASGRREPRARRRPPHDDPVVPPGPSTIDLHVHTTRSDGVLAPVELARAAAASGVRLLAISDHDTLAGYRDLTGEGSALPAGLRLLPAVEINAVTRGLVGLPDGELHLLGYGVDPGDPGFEATLARQRDARRTRFARTLERLRGLGLPIDEQVSRLDPTDEDALGRPTIARCLIEAGFATSVEDAFARLIGRGAPGYVPREGLGPVEAIRAIRAAGGLPSLAHFAEAPAHVELVRDLCEAGLLGLEIYYRAYGTATVAALADMAGALGLVATGGSDYHGDGISYAEQHAGLWVPAEVGDRFLAAVAALSTPVVAT